MLDGSTNYAYIISGNRSSETRPSGIRMSGPSPFSHHIDGVVSTANKTIAILRKNVKNGSRKIKGLAWLQIPRHIPRTAQSRAVRCTTGWG